MNRGRKLRSRGGVVAAVVAGSLALAGGTAWATGTVASIVGADGTINGCYQKENGQLRVVTEGMGCRDSELAIKWNQKGPEGAAGAVGPTGVQGPKGDKGDPGERGIAGVQGAAGPAGAAGIDGEDGAAGKDGVAGQDGAPGSNGQDGKDGVSVTNTSEPAGSNCANGGSKFTAASGVTYACNGAPGAPGGGGPSALEVVVASASWTDAACPAGATARLEGFGPFFGWYCYTGSESVWATQPTGSRNVVAACPSGKQVALGRGSATTGTVTDNARSDGRAWVATASGGNSSGTVTVHAICY